jgi:hypothetical protein
MEKWNKAMPIAIPTPTPKKAVVSKEKSEFPISSPQRHKRHKRHKGRKGHIIFRFGDLVISNFKNLF